MPPRVARSRREGLPPPPPQRRARERPPRPPRPAADAEAAANATAADSSASPTTRTRTRPPAKDLTQPHTDAEEWLSYGIFVFLLSSLVLACVGLSKISWHVTSGSYDAFGVRQVHMDAETHNLETMGLVWSVYTASRCALAFTILAILLTAHTLLRTALFVLRSYGHVHSLLRRSFTCAILFLFALMLYGALFPRHPFEGDITLYLNATSSTSSSSSSSSATSSSSSSTGAAHTSLFDADHSMPMTTLSFDDERRVDSWHEASQRPPSLAPIGESSQAHAQDATLAPLAATPLSIATDRIASVRVGDRGMPSFGPRIRPRTSRSLDASADAASFSSSSSPTVRLFPPRSKASSTSTSGESTAMFYSRMAWIHLTTVWSFGSGFWLVLSSALLALWWPTSYALFHLGKWTYERHQAAEVQQRWMLAPVSGFACAWLIAVIGLATSHWRACSETGDHFGLARVWIDDTVYTLSSYRFSSSSSRIHGASGAALAFGVIGVVSGFATWTNLIAHIYDRTRDRLTPFGLATLTAVVWTIALLAYAYGFPSYVGSNYFVLGWSFYLLVASTVLFSLPFLAFLAWRIQLRLAKTTPEERRMAVPLACVLLAVLLTLAAIGSEYWVADGSSSGGSNNHLGLLRGRLSATTVDFRDIAAISKRLSSIGMAALVILVCAIVIHLPACIIGLLYVTGRHDVCEQRAALINTALTAAGFILHLIACAAYAALVPYGALPDGYALSHSWRLSVASLVCALGSCVGFGYLAHPPLPGEKNLLAEAIEK